MGHTTELDTDEYLHLAMHASSAGDHHAALTYLKSVLANDRENIPALYLMATQHAELGLYLRAREELLHLLDLAPGMNTARFQLGLLHMQLGDTDSALQEFTHLSTRVSARLENTSTNVIGSAEEQYSVQRTPDDSLPILSQGLECLLKGESADAMKYLQTGINYCTNAPLKADMQRLLNAVAEKSGAAQSAQEQPVPAIPVAVSNQEHKQPVFLGLYRNANDDRQT